MTTKILVKVKTEGCCPQQFKQGDWIDLCLAEDVNFKAPQANKLHIRNKGKNNAEEVRTRDVDFHWYYAKLGIAMQLPDGYEAIVAPRSSTFRKYGVLFASSIGVIDNSYSGNNDEWYMPMLATRSVTVPKGTRIAQFRIQLSQKATFWQKLRWFISSGVNLKQAETLSNKDRGGLGSTD